MSQKLTTYVLTISRTFPTYHKSKGEPTLFIDKICTIDKIHTIRGNYELWRKRFEKIGQGKAELSLRYWDGKPYNSNQVEFCRLSNKDYIGIQKIEFDDYLYSCLIDGKRFDVSASNISDNDGLLFDDFESWFKPYNLDEPMAIIHFTKFRYA